MNELAAAMQDDELLRFPIGKYQPLNEISVQQIQLWIADLESFPKELDKFVSALTPDELENTYRPGGWTGRQVIHHLADSHINAYMRFHLVLTEEQPVIRPYHEERWAELCDGKTGDINLSIAILKAVHARLVVLLKSLPIDQFQRTYIHPETNKTYTMFYLLGNYVWHGKHHLGHLKLIKN